MKHIALPDYQALEHVLHDTVLKLHPSQAHGIISGILCGSFPVTDWEEKITGTKDAAEAIESLHTLYNITATQLSEFLFDFQLLLPEESCELSLRAEALTLWCQGFLTGLKLAFVQIVGRKPSEMTEAINDLIEVAKMNYEEIVANEEDEEAYTELVEYIRMAVILIHQEMSEDSGVQSSTDVSHLLH